MSAHQKGSACSLPQTGMLDAACDSDIVGLECPPASLHRHLSRQANVTAMNLRRILGFQHSNKKLVVGGRIFVRRALSHRVWDNILHNALTIRWPIFFASVAAAFLLLNALFALLYQCGTTPISHQYPHGFFGAFFFSIETLSTGGYGDMHPQTTYAHMVATVEIITGMASIALVTGLIFSRFSCPHAKIIFADNPVVRDINGKPTLMVRAANIRENVIAAASAQLHLLRMQISPESFKLRKIHDVQLVRDRHPIFMLS